MVTTIVLSMHVGALLLVFVLPGALWLKTGLAAFIGTSLWWQLLYGLAASACEIKIEEDGTCIRTVNGEQRRYRIARASTHTGFMRLMLKRAGERTYIQLVACDAVEAEIYRVLRARIAQQRLPVPESAEF